MYFMNKLLLALLVLATVVVAGCTQVGPPIDEPVSAPVPAVIGDDVEEMIVEEDSAVDDEPDAVEAPARKVKTFTVTGKNYRFTSDGKESPDIRVTLGDTVRIEFSNVGGFHDFSVNAFKAATERISDGQSASVEFVADKKGTFDYFCSVGSHRSLGMMGNLIVE